MDYINQLNVNLNSIENALQSEPSSWNPELVIRFTEILNDYRNDLESHRDLRENHIEEYEELSAKIIELSTRVGQLGRSIVSENHLRDEGLDLPSLEESHAPSSARREEREEEGPSWFQDENYVPVDLPSLEESQAPSPAGEEEEFAFSKEEQIKNLKDKLKSFREDLISLNGRINMYFPYLEAEEINKENPMSKQLVDGLLEERKNAGKIVMNFGELSKEAKELPLDDDPDILKDLGDLQDMIRDQTGKVRDLIDQAKRKNLMT